MSRDLELSAALDEGLAVVALVGPDRGPLVLVSPAVEHRKRRLALGGTAGDLDIHDQPVAVLHEDVPHVAPLFGQKTRNPHPVSTISQFKIPTQITMQVAKLVIG